MSYETIIYEKRSGVGLIKLNRPHRMNAVIEQMYLDLQDALAGAQNDPEIRALVLTGSVRVKDGVEKQAFCAGADLKKHSAGERTHGQKRDYILLAHETTRLIHDAEVPVIAAINGPARGAGSEMALSCDLVLMADEGSIGFPETGLGTFVGGGVTQHLPKLVGIARAKELVYTGRVLDGPAAVEMGLALASYPVEQLNDEAFKLAETIAKKAPLSIELAKHQLSRADSLDLPTVLLLEAEGILTCMDTQDWHEGLKAFAEHRAPKFEGK